MILLCLHLLHWQQAEHSAEQTNRKLPWANIKFASTRYEQDEMARGDRMSRPELAKYKYHIDLGGGGGTTWTGTIEKLAMPGLLFHHVTPTKDYIHDRLKPWRHYIPVSDDLKDLEKKFEWAESHPEQAKMIADHGTAFMRRWVPRFGQIVQEDLVEPLRRVIDAYLPVLTTEPGMKGPTNWIEFLEQSPAGNKMVPVLECRGALASGGQCEMRGGKRIEEWQKRGRYPGSLGGFSCPSCVA